MGSQEPPQRDHQERGGRAVRRPDRRHVRLRLLQGDVRGIGRCLLVVVAGIIALVVVFAIILQVCPADISIDAKPVIIEMPEHR